MLTGRGVDGGRSGGGELERGEFEGEGFEAAGGTADPPRWPFPLHAGRRIPGKALFNLTRSEELSANTHPSHWASQTRSSSDRTAARVDRERFRSRMRSRSGGRRITITPGSAGAWGLGGEGPPGMGTSF